MSYDKHCPLKKRKVNRDKIALQPFMTKGLLILRQTKNTMFSSYLKKRTPLKRERLREYVALYKKLCRLSEQIDLEKFINDNPNNSRKIWQLAKGK